MAERTDVAMQSYLDSLSQVPGSILYRTRREWRALPPGPPQSVLAWTEAAGLHWSLSLAGSGIGAPELTPSHDWTGPHSIKASGRTYGNVYEVGAQDLKVQAIDYWGRTNGDWFKCAIYRDSDAQLIAQIGIEAVNFTWTRQPIEPVTLEANTRYVFQHSPLTGGNRNAVREVTGFTVEPDLTFIEGRSDFTNEMTTTPSGENHPQVRVAF